jgi:hypothetical protein
MTLVIIKYYKICVNEFITRANKDMESSENDDRVIGSIISITPMTLTNLDLCRAHVVRFSLIHLCDGLSSRFFKKLKKSYFKDPFDLK